MKRALGRYEVALDSTLELREYKSFPSLSEIHSVSASEEPIVVTFQGTRLAWHPGTADYLPVVSVLIESGDDYRAEQSLVARFLSALSFLFGASIRIYTSAASSFKGEMDSPFLQQPRLKPTINQAPLDLTLEDDPNLMLCLALMREGLSATSEALRFLSLFKVIDVAVGEDAVDGWIDRQASELIHEDRPAVGWATHFRQARNASAHALRRKREDRHYDPDDPEHNASTGADARQLWKLARRAIEERWPTPVGVRRR